MPGGTDARVYDWVLGSRDPGDVQLAELTMNLLSLTVVKVVVLFLGFPPTQQPYTPKPVRP